MLLIVRLARLRTVVFRNAFRLKFNTHASTGFSICKGVVLRFMMAKKFTGFYRLIYYTGSRRLVEWRRLQKGFKQYYP
jgi:hypothetical protein